MSAVLERQRWLAALALAVAVPLPLTGVVSWPFLLPFLAVALWVVSSRRPLAPPPAWLENVLAPLILVAVVAAGGVQYGILRPVSQLAVLVAAVRLPGCGQRSRTLSTGGILALVGVAGIASSTHPSLALYLLALLTFVLLAVGRLTGVALNEGAMAGGRVTVWPPPRLVMGSVVVTVLAAAPLFALLPRLRSPFAAAPFGARSVSGFREVVMLHGIGDVKESRRLVMRVVFPGVEPGRVSPDWLRLVGATVKHYRAGGWVEGRLKSQRLAGHPEHPVALVEGAAAEGLRRAEIVLEKETGVLFVPGGTVSLTVHSAVAVTREQSGVLRIPRGTELPLPYGVEFDPVRVEQPPPDEVDLELPPGSDNLRALARQVTGRTTNSLAAALAIEQHLQRSYRYTLRTHAPVREDPVQWFLFRSREGHCEFFASSMVLLLRTLDIPARLQAGYAGGEPDGEGRYLVRDSQAHAWVLAYVNDKWRVFDPTPAEGRPGIVEAAGGPVVRWGWQRIEGLWDRWVLTFSLTDQVEFARQALEALAAGGRYLPPVALALGGLVAIVLLFKTRWKAGPRQPRATGRPTHVTRALQKAMHGAARRGVAVRPAMTAREFVGAASAAFPASGEPLAWLVREHERSRYAEGAAPARREVRAAVRAITRALERAHLQAPDIPASP
jgi:transglutaminase-like putative cysteine protease